MSDAADTMSEDAAVPHTAAGARQEEVMEDGATGTQPACSLSATNDFEGERESVIEVVPTTNSNPAVFPQSLRDVEHDGAPRVSTGSTSTDTYLERLRDQNTRFRRMVVSRVVTTGISCLVLGIVLTIVVSQVSTGWYTRTGLWTANLSQCILLHGVLPFDRRPILALALAAIIFFVFGLFMFGLDLVVEFVNFGDEDAVYSVCMLLRTFGVLLFLIGSSVILPYYMKTKRCDRLLIFLWTVSRGWIFLNTSFYLLLVIVALGLNLPDEEILHKLSHLIVHILCCILVLRRVRQKTRECLVGRDGAIKAAATIAGLMAGIDQKVVWKKAKTTFRGISCDKLTREIMANQKPDPKLYALSTPKRWGKVDAFLTHSWHDDPGEKWRCLQQWRMEFKAKHHREPVLWIDKFCIDQTDIEHSLQCLPVWLAECQQLLMIAGSTYLTRLWCIMELFTFLESSGASHQVVLCPLSASDGVSFSTLVQEFDASNATCFLQEDKDRLLSVVEEAFGSLDSFSERVRVLLSELNDPSSEIGCRCRTLSLPHELGQPSATECQEEAGDDESV